MTLEGKTIENVRPMTAEEARLEGWGDSPHQAMVIELDDGSKLYPSQDPEGNGPGALFGHDGLNAFMVTPKAED